MNKKVQALKHVLLSATVFLIAVVSVFAQDAPPTGAPIARVEAGDFRALAVTSDGQFLMVADAANNQLRVYDLREDGEQRLIASVAVDGTPIDVATAGDFAIVLVDTGTDTDLVQVIAPASYDPAQAYAPTTWIDIPNDALSVSVSHNNRWAVAVSRQGYTLLELLNAENVNFTTTDLDINDVALTNDRLFIALADEARIVTAELELDATSAQAQASLSLELDSPARHVLINSRGTFGAAALENGDLVLFERRLLEPLSQTNIGQVRDIQFIRREDGEWLVALNERGTEVTIYDLSNTREIGEIGSLTLETASSLQAIYSFDSLLFVADRSAVNIYPTGDDNGLFEDN